MVKSSSHRCNVHVNPARAECSSPLPSAYQVIALGGAASLLDAFVAAENGRRDTVSALSTSAGRIYSAQNYDLEEEASRLRAEAHSALDAAAAAMEHDIYDENRRPQAESHRQAEKGKRSAGVKPLKGMRRVWSFGLRGSRGKSAAAHRKLAR